MKYKTVNEFHNFSFAETHISDIQITSGFFHMELDDVKIAPSNSCNRDIRQMRCNSLIFKLTDGHVVSLIADGYKVYDADGKLMREVPDIPVLEGEYLEVCKNFVDGSVYDIAREEKDNGEINYIFSIDDVEDASYTLVVAATGDTEEWDRFLNLEA